MNFPNPLKKRLIIPVVMLFAFPLLLLVCPPVKANGGETDAVIASPGRSQLPIYRQPEPEQENRRRERSVEGGETRGWARGLTRGFARGLTRGWARGLTRGKGSEIPWDTPVDSEQERLRLPTTISPIAPLRTGLTLKPQPVLQWYTSSACDYKIEFTLNKSGAIEPLLKFEIKDVDKEGIYRVDLARNGVSLVPGVEYEWFVVISLLRDEPSFDYLASATIIYEKAPDSLSRRIRNTPDDKRHILYAEKGYWYDAMESLSNMIAENPGDDTFKRHRHALFAQVQLPPRVTAYGGAID